MARGLGWCRSSPPQRGTQPTDVESESSIIVIDTRDNRPVSPFQCWLVKEIMTNARSSINVLTERDRVMPPSSGFHLTLFANYTLDRIKAAVVMSVDSETGSPCRDWDGPTLSRARPAQFTALVGEVVRKASETSDRDGRALGGRCGALHFQG